MIKKNALTRYSIAKMPERGSEVTDSDYMALAEYINSVTDSTDETADSVGYYDGDGTPETQVTDRLEQYEFEGIYNSENEAMKHIDSIKREVGAGRKVMFKIEYDNGDIAEGPATVSSPITNGGEATEFKLFSCTIGFNRTPELTKADTP